MTFERARSFFLQGLALHNAGRYADAEGLYRQALALMPERVSVLVNLAAVLASQRQPGEALDHCERALAIEPGNVEALSTRALCRRMLQGTHAQLEDTGEDDGQHPDDPEALSNRGVMLFELGELEDALACFDRALASSEPRPGVVCNRAAVLVAMGRTSEALQLYSAVLRDAPEFSAAGEGFLHLLQNTPLQVLLDSPEIDFLAVTAIESSWARPVMVAPLLAASLRGKAGIRPLLALPSAATSPADALQALLPHRTMLCALLRNSVIPDAGLERALSGLRDRLLQMSLATEGDPDPAVLDLHCALAIQCHLNDYLYPEHAFHRRAVEDLAREIARARESGRQPRAEWLAGYACHRPLAALPEADWLLGLDWPPPVRALLTRQVLHPRQEALLRDTLPRLTAIHDPTSHAVRAQYETHPYPKWHRNPGLPRAVSLQDYVQQHLPGSDLPGDGLAAQQPSVLIAGCGTGQQAVETAARLAGSQVLGIDLSLASLAYAARMAEASGLRNLAFAQADILQLERLDKRFDLIESSGVLHHMHSPVGGLRVLAALLAPGGLLRLALYSASARPAVVAAHRLIAAHGYPADADGVRRCRAHLLSLPDSDPAAAVTRFPDFYSLSECRDLLFHVCEHRYTAHSLMQLLAQSGLAVVGFEPVPALRRALGQTRRAAVTWRDADDLAAFEHRHPDVFAGMYQFWARPAA